MSERTKLFYGLLRLPAFYAFFQKLIGEQNTRKRIVEAIIRPAPGMRVLDAGCGSGSMRPYLGDVNYTGIDLNARHIETARKNGFPGDRYMVGDIVTDLSFEPGSFDLVLLVGVLHHIDDESARGLLHQSVDLLSAWGRIVTFDGVRVENPRTISKFLLDRDVGKHVRTEQEYLMLCDGLPVDVEVTLFADLLKLPYDHCAMTITRSRG